MISQRKITKKLYARQGIYSITQVVDFMDSSRDNEGIKIKMRALKRICECGTLRRKSPYLEFLVRIFPHLDWIRRNTEYLSVFSPNARICRPEKTPNTDTFHIVELSDTKQTKTTASQQYKDTLEPKTLILIAVVMIRSMWVF